MDALDRIARLEEAVDHAEHMLEKVDRRMLHLERAVWVGIGLLGALQFVAPLIINN